MSIISKQIELGKKLVQININTLRGFAELQRDGIERYFELNRGYGDKLPQVKDISGFVALQRDYSESMWTGFRSSIQSQASLVKEAFSETGAALKATYQPASKEAEAEEVEVAAKPAPKTTSKSKTLEA